jgi:hypothetical protein
MSPHTTLIKASAMPQANHPQEPAKMAGARKLGSGTTQIR